jgi:hypothetical protein
MVERRHQTRMAGPWALPLKSSSVEALALEVRVQAGDELGAAVEELGADALVGAEDALHRLAPAGMGHGGVDVRPEAVLRRLSVGKGSSIGQGVVALGSLRATVLSGLEGPA